MGAAAGNIIAIIIAAHITNTAKMLPMVQFESMGIINCASGLVMSATAQTRNTHPRSTTVNKITVARGSRRASAIEPTDSMKLAAVAERRRHRGLFAHIQLVTVIINFEFARTPDDCRLAG